VDGYMLYELTLDAPEYPAGVRHALGARAPERIAALGDVALLGGRMLALVGSVRAPGSIILGAYDLALALRDAGVTVAGGFHAPMERECLRILLRGAQPVSICPARSIAGMRVPAAWRGPLEQRRLLLLSPFPPGKDRVTAATAVERNRFVAALANTLFVTHATAGGKTEALAREAVRWGRTVWTLEDEANSGLIALGARSVLATAMREWAASFAHRA